MASETSLGQGATHWSLTGPGAAERIGRLGTTLVLAELHGLLVQRAGPDAARRAIAALLDDPIYEWLDVPQDLVRNALGSWLERFRDQPFTLTDAVSFEVMRRKRIKHAFAFDGHFVTAGYSLLG